jgi:hypothetical protein
MVSSVDFMFWSFVIGLLLAIGFGSYDAFWSLNLGRALRVKSYARQLLIIGLFSVYGTALFFLFYTVYFLSPNLLNSPVYSLQVAFYAVLPPLTFAWVDSTIRLGRRSDPLLRDPLRWSKLRLVLWPLLLASLVGFLSNGGANVITLFSFAIIAVSVLPILKAARWSGDIHYRRSLQWFGIAIAGLVFQNFGFQTLMPGLGTGLVYSTTGFIWSILANFGLVPVLFYCIYMCARSLVPLNRLST